MALRSCGSVSSMNKTQPLYETSLFRKQVTAYRLEFWFSTLSCGAKKGKIMLSSFHKQENPPLGINILRAVCWLFKFSSVLSLITVTIKPKCLIRCPCSISYLPLSITPIFLPHLPQDNYNDLVKIDTAALACGLEELICVKMHMGPVGRQLHYTMHCLLLFCL